MLLGTGPAAYWRIRTGITREQWDDVLRLVGSIKAGYVTPSAILRKLAAATDDIPARKMHLPMAAEYRRKAMEMEAIQSVPPPHPDYIGLR